MRGEGSERLIFPVSDSLGSYNNLQQLNPHPGTSIETSDSALISRVAVAVLSAVSVVFSSFRLREAGSSSGGEERW